MSRAGREADCRRFACRFARESADTARVDSRGKAQVLCVVLVKWQNKVCD
ncbi:MAG: hypothetical protein LUG93_00275 [Lachnospiraceae bacterium]|nr:hypothetical protein [Lachnospiraceae bacterium]